jgi:outer membrane autotransporter protein
VPMRIPSSAKSQWGVWMRGYGSTASAPATANTAPYNENGAGLIVGADTPINDRLVAGVAVNIATDKANVTGGGFNLSDSYQGSAYAQYHMDDNWYINGIAGFSWQTYSSARVVQLVTPSTANASYDGQGYRAYGETGYVLRPQWLSDQSFVVTPLVGIGYLHAHTSAFTETGSPAALSLQAGDSNSLATDLGFRANLTWRVGDSVFRPEIRASWEHEWLDAAGTIHSAFVASPGNVMTATGNAFSRESFIGGAGMTTAVTSSTQLFIDFDAKVNGGYVANVISGGARIDF